MIAQASLPSRAVYGAAAVNHVAKLLRSNVITSTVVVALTATPDFYRAAIARSISWRQFSKNLVTAASGVAAGVGGWMSGAAAGAALGSVVPVIGTAVGGFVGGILGALGGGWLGSAGAKAVTDWLAEDDAQRMLRFVQEVVEELASDHLLCEAEIKEFIDKVKKKVDPAWLRSMYQAGKGADPDAARRAFAHDKLDKVCLTITKKREKVALPAPEQVQAEIEELADEVLEAETSTEGDEIEPDLRECQLEVPCP